MTRKAMHRADGGRAGCWHSASIRAIQRHARDGRTHCERPHWPMIVLRSPKGWTGPKEVDGLKVEGFWRAHQVPIANAEANPAHLALLEAWMRSYAAGRIVRRRRASSFRSCRRSRPKASRRMGANPHANGGLLKRELETAGFSHLRGGGAAARRRDRRGDPRNSANSCARSCASTQEARNFRIMGPDETASNRLDAVFEVTERVWMEPHRTL